jgi:hypothetical protein
MTEPSRKLPPRELFEAAQDKLAEWDVLLEVSFTAETSRDAWCHVADQVGGGADVLALVHFDGGRWSPEGFEWRSTFGERRWNTARNFLVSYPLNDGEGRRVALAIVEVFRGLDCVASWTGDVCDAVRVQFPVYCPHGIALGALCRELHASDQPVVKDWWDQPDWHRCPHGYTLFECCHQLHATVDQDSPPVTRFRFDVVRGDKTERHDLFATSLYGSDGALVEAEYVLNMNLYDPHKLTAYGDLYDHGRLVKRVGPLEFAEQGGAP